MPQSSSPGAALEIRVLGPLEVLVAGEPIRVDTRKALAVVALLAVEGRPYARDELAAMFWPESDDESARGALRRTLSVLRTALGGRWLRVDRATVALDLDGVGLDLAVLDSGAASDDLDGLVRAAGVARGPFLAGFSLRDSPDYDDWRATRAVAIERLVAQVLDRLAAVAEASGDLPGAIDAASRRLELDPLDEPARRRVMALLARAGDRAGAIRQYRAGVAILERELGVPPLAETTELYDAIRDARVSTPPLGPQPPGPGPVLEPTAHPARLPFVGRDAELAALRAVHRAAVVDGRLALLVGEAGIGKSRLAEEFQESIAVTGSQTLAARAFPAEGAIAYGPVVELLRTGITLPGAAGRLKALGSGVLREIERLVPLPPGVAGPPPDVGAADTRAEDQPAARARLLNAIATTLTALVAGPEPGLIVVEDVQWADDASREVLRFLAHRLDGRPLLLLLTLRPEDLDDRGETFAASMDGLAAAAPITLERFQPGDVEALVAAAVRAGLPGYDAASLSDVSEGLPLYVVEALAVGPVAASAGPPRGVRALLRDRLGSVSETAGQVLAAGAVVGRSFDLATVRAASGRSEDETITALEELVRRGIVREVRGGSGTVFDFGHARLRDAAYDATSLARRRLLHRRVAEVLRAAPDSQDVLRRLALIAGHERAAGRDTEAAEAFREAGVRARAVYANLEAIDHFETALALGHPDVVGLQTSIGELRTRQGDYVGAVAALEAAAAVTADEELPAIELRLGRVHARRGDAATAASHLDSALETLDQRAAPSLDAPLLGGVLVERSVVALRSGDLLLAQALAERALDVGTADGDARAIGAGHRLLGLVARARGDLVQAKEALIQSLAVADRDPDPGAAIAACNALALVEAAAGDRETAITLLEDALAECRRTGETHLEAAVENNLADQLHAAGRHDEAMAHLKHAVSLFAEVGGRPGELEPEIWKLVSW